MRRLGIILATLLVGLVFAAPAQAKRGLGFEVYGGLSGYEMSEMNDSLAAFNDLVGTDLGEIANGAIAGGALRFRVRDRVLVRAGVEHWFANSSDDDLEFNVSVWALPITVTYWLNPASPMRLGIGVGVVPYNISGAFRSDDFEFDASGSGFAGQLFGEAEWSLGGAWSLNTVAGYRFANSDVLTLDDQAFAAEPDYSGPWVRFGIAIDGQ
jgi:hypothetical protein